MIVDREIHNALTKDGFYRLFLIPKSQIPNRFFRMVSGRFYKINNEIIKSGTIITHTLRSTTGWVREAIFFTDHKYTEEDLAKYLKNKKNIIHNLDEANIQVTITKQTEKFENLVRYIKRYSDKSGKSD